MKKHLIRPIVIAIILLLEFCSAISLARSTSERMPAYASFSSPYHTVYTHLRALQDDSYRPEVAARTLSTEVNLPSRRRAELAVQLKQAMDARALFVDLASLPRDRDWYDSAAEAHEYVVFSQEPRITLLREPDGRWRYSSSTVAAIPELFEEAYPLGTWRLISLLPEESSTKYFGLYAWQQIGILIIVLFSLVFYKVFAWGIRTVLGKSLKKTSRSDIVEYFIDPVAKPVALLTVMFCASLAVPLLQLPPELARWAIVGLRALAPLFAIAVFYRLVDVVAAYLDRLARRTESTLDDQLVPLIRKALKLFVVIAGIIFTLQNLNFNVTTLLAGVSIGGAALALASQDTIKNLFGSVMIFSDRPFQIGDWIKFGDVEGTVEEVGFRSTRIRTFYNSVVSIPNGRLADMTVDNMGLRVYRRFRTTIQVEYSTTPAQIKAFVDGLHAIVEQHPDTRKDVIEIVLNDFGASSLDILFYIFFHVDNWTAELRARQEIMIAIVELAATLGVSFAFPTQTLHIASSPEHPSEPTPHQKMSEQQQRDTFAGWFARYAPDMIRSARNRNAPPAADSSSGAPGERRVS